MRSTYVSLVVVSSKHMQILIVLVDVLRYALTFDINFFIIILSISSMHLVIPVVESNLT